jgi:hypothetical protein
MIADLKLCPAKEDADALWLGEAPADLDNTPGFSVSTAGVAV